MATEYMIKRVLRMIGTNWRRTDNNFYFESYPTYYAAFEEIEDKMLEALITKFMIEREGTYAPTIGVIRKYVMQQIGEKEAVKRKNVLSCDDCSNGLREISYLYKKQGRYHMNILKAACTCPAGTQKVTLTKNITIKRAVEVYDEIRTHDRCIMAWITSREDPDIPLVGLPCGNPLMQKQLENDAKEQGRLKRRVPTLQEMQATARAAYKQEQEKRGW